MNKKSVPNNGFDIYIEIKRLKKLREKLRQELAYDGDELVAGIKRVLNGKDNISKEDLIKFLNLLGNNSERRGLLSFKLHEKAPKLLEQLEELGLKMK